MELVPWLQGNRFASPSKTPCLRPEPGLSTLASIVRLLKGLPCQSAEPSKDLSYGKRRGFIWNTWTSIPTESSCPSFFIQMRTHIRFSEAPSNSTNEAPETNTLHTGRGRQVGAATTFRLLPFNQQRASSIRSTPAAPWVNHNIMVHLPRIPQYKYSLHQHRSQIAYHGYEPCCSIMMDPMG